MVIPRKLSVNYWQFVSNLVRRVDRHQRRKHVGQPGEPAWPDYHPPASILDLAEGFRGGEQEDRDYLFAGPVPKPRSHALGLRIFVGMVTALLAGLALCFVTEDSLEATAGLGTAAAVFGFFLLVSLKRARKKNPTSWFYISPDGLAMVGPSLTGELFWEDILEISGVSDRVARGSFALSSAGTGKEVFSIRTHDGARIVVEDKYDAPLYTLWRLCSDRKNQADRQAR